MSGTAADEADMSAEGVEIVSGDGPRPDDLADGLFDAESTAAAAIVSPVQSLPLQDSGLPKLALKSEREIVADPLAATLPPIVVTPLAPNPEAGPTPRTPVATVRDAAEPEVVRGAEQSFFSAADDLSDFASATLPNAAEDPASEEPEAAPNALYANSVHAWVSAPEPNPETGPNPPIVTIEAGRSLLIVNVDPLRGVVDIDDDGGEAKPANWFLAADAFGAHSRPDDAPTHSDNTRSRGKSKRTDEPKHGGAPRETAHTGRSSRSFAVFALVVVVLIGGFVKVAVLDRRNASIPPAELALHPTSLSCGARAPMRSALRYERHLEVEEIRRDSNLVETTRTRFVDNEAKNFIARLNGSASESEILVGGRHFVATQPDVWSEVPFTEEQIAAAFALPFADRFTDATWLNDTAVSGVATCVYSSLLGRVTLPNGERISNAQLELYVDSSSQYRRVRVRGARLVGAAAEATAEASAIPDPTAVSDPAIDTSAIDTSAIETYVLTIDIESAPPFVPNVPV